MRPARVCWCGHLPSIDTKTRLLLVQHPREEFVAIGTGRMTALCLPLADLVVGVRVEDDPRVRAALDDPTRTPILLWPGPGARDLAREPPAGPTTLVVVDGTWSLARQLVRENPRIRALPRYALDPPEPSQYRIRPEPADACVSTLEAVMHALGILEGDPGRFSPMMAPFRAMVDMQIEHQERLHGGRVRAKAKKRERSRRLPDALRLEPSLVVVTGEANAWARRSASGHADEIVQWLAVRPATGERFEALVAPSKPLSPGTPLHTRLAPELLARGTTLAEAQRAFRAFVRDDDTACGWGHYSASLWSRLGGFLPPTYVDLRGAAARWSQSRPGSLEDFARRLGLAPTPLGTGRGGERVALVAAIAEHMIRQRST